MHQFVKHDVIEHMNRIADFHYSDSRFIKILFFFFFKFGFLYSMTEGYNDQMRQVFWIASQNSLLQMNEM